MEHYRSHVAVFLGERRFLTEEGFAEVKTKRDQMEDIFFSVVKRGQETGRLRADLEARVVGLGIIGMCAWAYQ